jgi:hypothetical protein
MQLLGPHGGGEQNPPPTPLKVHVSLNCAQFEHCWPPLPHANGATPGMHIWPWQHPRPQLFGPHSWGAQKPPLGNVELHVSPNCEQFEHCCPLVPHANGALPGRQVWPWQHPLQFVGLHDGGGVVQMPPAGPVGWHVSPKVVQLAHCMPFRPHAVGSPPGSHRLPKQQPGQFCGPHVGIWQKPFWQERPLMAQLAHVPPPWPHCPGKLPETQKFPEQHPGQLPGPHGGGGTSMHWCEFGSQLWNPSAMQSWQEFPPVPQAVVARPSSQPPLISQQPFGQVKGLQVPVSGTSSGASPTSSPPSSGTT